MFDRLVESDTTGAEFKNRSRYFMVSSLIVGILFLTAVVYSLYAAEIGLGDGHFAIAELISPITPDAPEPKPPREQAAAQQASSPQTNSDSNMARTDEPTFVPQKPSVERNTQLARDWKPFNPELPPSNGSGAPNGVGTGSSDTGTTSNNVAGEDKNEVEAKTTEPPPPISKPKTPGILRTSKVLNGEALSLPKPAYPQTARTMGLEGTVKVQVTIDKTGSVVSAKAADGHSLFRLVSEQAAKGAKFRPTFLNGEPVIVTGVIVYNFRRN